MTTGWRVEIEGVDGSGRDAGLGTAQAETLVLRHLDRAGYTRIEPPILQDAAVFLDLGGEDIRAGLYLIGNGSGPELCLRPEFTIPACQAYLDTRRDGASAAFCYCGPVFQQRVGEHRESRQAGLESFGRDDVAAADAETLCVALEAAAAGGAPPLAIAMGDAGLMSAVLAAIDLPPLWQRRLRRGLERGHSLDDILAGAPSDTGDRSGVAAALTGANGSDARALVEDLLSVAGIAAVGGRTVAEIAERFLTQVAQHASAGFGSERREVLGRFLDIVGNPDAASGELHRLARHTGLDLGAALDLFDERIGFMAAQGIDVATVTFRTAFARNLDYYTGFVFEARATGGPAMVGGGPALVGGGPAIVGDGPAIVGGGRYDRLAQALGSATPVPAVGAAIFVERLAPGAVS